ncbi:MAG: glycosyl transferase, group 1 [Acidobacteria bacterium]|nr:glycosyl transferase, group 1 [Acidobacteriota bacterium]
MKILHLAAGNRWTGAAAPAFAEVEALRAAGVDAHYAYVGGYKLEAKIGHCDFAHPLIEKAQHPVAFRRSLDAIERMVDRHGFDYIHAHLTYDHWLARFAARAHRIRLARTFHARRVIRSDPFTTSLINASTLLCSVNDSFNAVLGKRGLTGYYTPPPLDLRQFRPDGPDLRAAYGLDAATKVVTVIGKLSKGRGFEEALQTFAILRNDVASVKLMIIGHGEHRPKLEAMTRVLDIEQDVLWAGYHEHDLAAHYRTANALLFTARGSDEGHRAVLEAMACGVPPATMPIAGMRGILGPLADELIAYKPEPRALAARAAYVLTSEALPVQVTGRSLEFGYDRAAARLVEAYEARM